MIAVRCCVLFSSMDWRWSLQQSGATDASAVCRYRQSVSLSRYHQLCYHRLRSTAVCHAALLFFG